MSFAMGGSPPPAPIDSSSTITEGMFEVKDLQTEIVFDDGKKVRLTWQNPSDEDFEGVVIVVRTDRHPENINDVEENGKVLAVLKGRQGAAQSFEHEIYDDREKYVKYKDPTQYYLVVTYDKDGKYSRGLKGLLPGMII